MPNIMRALGPAEVHAEDSDTDAATEATLGDPGDGFRWLVKSVSFSADRAPVAVVEVTISDGATVIRRYEVPTAAFAPAEIGFGSGLLCSEDNEVKINASDPGSNVKFAIAISGTKIKAS